MKCVTLIVGVEFTPVERGLNRDFLLDLFYIAEAQILGQEVKSLTAKQSIQKNLDQNTSTPNNRRSSFVITAYLVATLWVQTEFRLGNHAMILKYGFVDIITRNTTNNVRDLYKVMITLPPIDPC